MCDLQRVIWDKITNEFVIGVMLVQLAAILYCGILRPKDMTDVEKRTDMERRASDLLQMATIRSQFPLKFDNGYIIQDFNVACPVCKNAVEHDLFCGIIKKINPSQFLMEAAGACKKCKVASAFEMKLFDDKTFATKVEGKWLTTSPPVKRPVVPMAKKPSPLLDNAGGIIRVSWIVAYIVSIWPALMEISDGNPNVFNRFFITNGALIALGYACSLTILSRYNKKQ